MASLRIILDGPRHPQFNMAIDEALARMRPAVGVDTVRIYMWLPPGLSLGRRQSVDEVNLDEARRRGYVMVRRPTGGAALLHPWPWEVTYSVVLSSDHMLARMDVASSAAAIASGVALAIEKLGLEAGVGGFRGVGSGGLCYVRPGSSDVVVMGRKVSGSAQRRLPGALLQHGTLLLRFNAEEWLSIIPVEGLTAQDLASKVAGIYDIMGGEVGLRRVYEALAEGLAEALGYREWSREPLSADELDEAHRLYSEKYSRPEWNMSGLEKS